MPGNPFTAALDAPAPAPATERQLSFLRKLMVDKAELLGKTEDEVAEELDRGIGGLSKTYASQMIDRTIAMIAELGANGGAKATILTDHTAPELEDGFYELPDGRLVKIIHAVHGSGRQYGKVLNTATGGFDLLRGAVKLVRDGGTALTLDRAKELGHLYGMCIRCGATLTDETSIANGIGPICAQRF